MDPDGRKYLSGINCGAEVAQQSFLATKNLYGKAGGTFFYHYVQSFSPQEQVSFAEAHQIALELAERFFPGCEVLVATHVDAEHPHSHFVVNSVHPDTGKKLHFTPRTLEQMRAISDQLCQRPALSGARPVYPQAVSAEPAHKGTPHRGVPGRSAGGELEVPAHHHRGGGHGACRQPGGVHPGNGAAGLPGALGGRPEVYHLHHPHRDEVPGRPAARGKIQKGEDGA